MEVRRLFWAGIELRSGTTRLLIDPLEDPEPAAGLLGAPRQGLGSIEVDQDTWAAVTHLHPDHCDRGLLRRVPRGQVLCHEPIATQLGITAGATRLWHAYDAGPFRVTPVPSHDWRGDDQVAWVVEAEGRCVIHCGDTIWHGGWYEIARRHGPFDTAFLPINGVTVRLQGFTATDVPATLTPEQAIEAAVVLGAHTACAIHYGLFHNPPLYVEQPNPRERFRAAANRRGLSAITPADGEQVRWA
jgi:L-ascorbate metabolism protein UlaG (beta-lactamase superfamily)